MYGAQQLAYAPTPYSYTPSSNLAATINLDQEVKLADSATERELYESLAEIYSIIITLDALEKAYLRDSIHESEYTETCDRLLRQYKSNLADETVADAFGDLERFKAEWHLEVPKATERLRIGIPATVETAPASQQRPNSQQPTNNAAATHIVAASESFITLLDAIKLNMLSKETLHPILVDTIQAVNKVTDRDFENKAKIIQWLITLNQMRVAEDLSSEQARELQFDMQLAYDGFKASVTALGGDFSEFRNMQAGILSPIPISRIGVTTFTVGFKHLLFKMQMQRTVWQDEEDEEPLDVLDLPQLYTKPSAPVLLSTLDDLSVQPLSWEKSEPSSAAPQRHRRKINNEGVPQYLTKIISSPLVWIEDDVEKEQIWEAASQRLSERSGRTAMGAITRSFAIPLSLTVPSDTATQVMSSGNELSWDRDTNNIVQLTLYEPPMTSDNLGLKTWASSYLLAKQLCSLRQYIQDLAPDVAILELGAGTGLVGMAAALVFERHAILTDLPEIVPNLEQNARSNLEAISSRGGTISAAVLDWTSPEDLELESFDGSLNSFPLIVVADPIYSSDHPRMLVDAIKCHLSMDKSARLVIELPLRDAYADERQDLRDRLAGIGLRIIEQGEEVGYDDWSAGQGEELSEVKCWWSVWGRQ